MLKKLFYYSGFTFVRWQFIFILLGGALIYYTLLNYFNPDSDNLKDELVWRIAQILMLFFSMLMVTAMLSTLIAWLWLYMRYDRIMSSMKAGFGEGQKAVAGDVEVSVMLPQIIRPLFGTVTARLVFKDESATDIIPLDTPWREKGKLFRSGIRGSITMPLRDRKEYHVAEVQVMFRDMLRLTLISSTIPFERIMFVTPPEKPLRDIKAEPNKTEEQLERIKIPKKVEGEFLHYKDFESGDDVRRIVWKIYARTRQLVVRIPEITDPYASHIYFYASFYHGFLSQGNSDIDQELQNCYKDQLRNLYESVLSNGYEVRFITDQDTSTNFSVTEKEKPVYHISTAHWQTSKDLRSYVNVNDVAMVCVTALVPAADVEALLQRCPPNVTVVLVRIADELERLKVVRFRDLFIVRRPDPMNALVRRWKFSGYRKNILKNEKAIEALLRASSQNVLTT